MIKRNLSNISKKSKMIAATAFVLGIVAVGGTASVANAQSGAMTSQMGKQNHMSSLVSTIATKFNLTPAEVQAVVDSVMKNQHNEMEAKMKGMFTSRLAAAVTAGKLTQTQANLITAKADELKATMAASREADKNLTAEQRKAKIDATITSLKQWAIANNIPEEYLRFGGGHRFGDKGMHKGPKGADK